MQIEDINLLTPASLLFLYSSFSEIQGDAR